MPVFEIYHKEISNVNRRLCDREMLISNYNIFVFVALGPGVLALHETNKLKNSSAESGMSFKPTGKADSTNL